MASGEEVKKEMEELRRFASLFSLSQVSNYHHNFEEKRLNSRTNSKEDEIAHEMKVLMGFANNISSSSSSPSFPSSFPSARGKKGSRGSRGGGGVEGGLSPFGGFRLPSPEFRGTNSPPNKQKQTTPNNENTPPSCPSPSPPPSPFPLLRKTSKCKPSPTHSLVSSPLSSPSFSPLPSSPLSSPPLSLPSPPPSRRRSKNGKYSPNMGRKRGGGWEGRGRGGGGEGEIEQKERIVREEAEIFANFASMLGGGERRKEEGRRR